MKNTFILVFIMQFASGQNIEGRWILPMFEGDPGNTMYEFLDGLRYTYYCTDDNGCDSTYWNSLDTSDALPTINPYTICLLYTSPSPRDGLLSRMPSSA